MLTQGMTNGARVARISLQVDLDAELHSNVRRRQMRPSLNAIKISEHVYWVGAIDWDVRDFH
ncbi:MAG TPA: hypothetical protein VF960_06085, partial [Chloroflexota bacterium]